LQDRAGPEILRHERTGPTIRTRMSATAKWRNQLDLAMPIF